MDLGQDQCRFYFLHAMFETGRLLFYHIDDTQVGWRRASFTSMALLSDRVSNIEMVQKSIEADVNAVLQSTKRQMITIARIEKSLDDLYMMNINANMNEIRMKVIYLEEKLTNVEEKIINVEEKINNKIDKMHASTNEELQK
jgi:hypothetical protein